jgi:two-component system OmpR family sensor kinase
VTYSSLRTFLYRRIDEQLASTAALVVRALAENGERVAALGTPAQLHEMLPNRTYVEVRDTDGTVRASATAAAPGEPAPAVRLPVNLPGPAPPSVAGDPKHFGPGFSVASGDGPYRALTAVLPGSGRVLVVGLPLEDVEATLSRLATVEITVAGAVVLLGGGLALWLVRLGLRPLTAITHTAVAITAGDLSRRVERERPDSEVGQLGLAVNTMLDQIEVEITERRASEDRMRRFVADASHELRTPLSAIRACAELFRRGAADRRADLAQVVRRIEDGAARMGILVDDLLLLARLDTGQPPAEQTVDLAEIARLCVDDARLVDPDRPLVLDAAEPAPVTGDPHALRRAVDNLLANVRAHTPSQALAHIRVGSADDRVFLEVVDTGPGVPPEQASRVFDRFYRADPARSSDRGGTGLGLSVVATIAEAHGGSVELVSTVGHGATFRMRFPAGRAGTRQG